MMSILGNVLWFIFAGFWQGIAWLFIGFLWCITIIGIPIGVQCFKLSRLAFFPFGKQVVHEGGVGSCLLNILWIVFGGWPIALAAVGNGLLLCVTIIGIPFGLQCFKFARLAFMPFGARVVRD
ncbi:MAG: YccF domain-containing protein [Turicibacter sp.]|nr:YccF domain-containing protein [Turicibacter sp.]